VRHWCPKWIFAGAAAGLLLGGGAVAYGLRAPEAVPSPGVRPPGLTSPGNPAPPIAPPQYGRYRGYSYGPTNLDYSDGLHEFYFTRAIYSGGGFGRRRGGSSWAVDYPKADIQFLWGLKRLTNIDAYEWQNAVLLTDPNLRRFPFLYMLEVGSMHLPPDEVESLRGYLLAGGFLFVDDFWGTWEWQNFEYEIHQVLPEYEIVELPADHPLLSTFYVIDEILQVPNVGNARRGVTSEQDGYVPHMRAIFDDSGRLLVLINWNTDLGDAWEWAEDPWYPLKYSNFAYQVAVNAIIYSMSH